MALAVLERPPRCHIQQSPRYITCTRAVSSNSSGEVVVDENDKSHTGTGTSTGITHNDTTTQLYPIDRPLRHIHHTRYRNNIKLISQNIMSFLHLFIVNKSGGLIHHRPLSKPSPPTHPKNTIGTNEWLRIASTFHSLYAIAAEASPIRLPNQKNYGTYVRSCCT